MPGSASFSAIAVESYQHAGALILGLFESFGTVFLGSAQMAVPYMLLAAVLLLRPHGLFGREV